jgi:hypothetical protein
MTLDELLNQIFAGETHALALQFAAWAAESPRFRAFAEAYRTKIRKKVRGMADEAGLRDLRAELEIAHLLLGERRFAVEYEKGGVGQRRSPDFYVTFRANLGFNVEVKHVRLAVDEPRTEAQEFGKLANAVSQKIGQLAPGMLNLLALSYERPWADGFDGPAALVRLRRLAEQKEDAFFARRGLADGREFLRQFQHLSAAIFYVHLPTGVAHGELWLNSGARQRLPDELRNALQRVVSASPQG